VATHRIKSRPARGTASSVELVRDAELLASYLEDAAHFPGGNAEAVAFPRSEADVAALLTHLDRVLVIGAQSSVTGGATPDGGVVMSTAKLNRIVEVGASHVRVQPGATIAALAAEVARHGRYYPPAPTYDGAFVGGTIGTNASGAATFKYGSTRRWVEALTVVLATGDVLDLRRGEVRAHPDGYFEVALANGVRRVPVPRYRMPDVPKRSAGYFAEPEMDLIDLFIGSEGTLGVVVEAVLRLIEPIPTTCLALVPIASEATALDLVGQLRQASIETRRSGDRHGLDVSAIEFLDRRCLEMLREDGADRRCDVSVPSWADIALLVQIEMAPGTTAEAIYEQVAAALDERSRHNPLGRFCRLVADAGALDATELVMPGDRARARRLFDFREAAPEAVKTRVAQAKARTGAAIEKVAADMIVPFDRFGAMMARYRDGYRRRGLDHAVWGHISDSHVHPNVIPRSIDEVAAGKEAILEYGREVVALGGCPLAEHGVGRSPVKQALLRQLYGPQGLDDMRRVKTALDPDWKLAPGVLFARSG
jgi:D-lactate dehydrogenase (cytochrome)